MYNSLISGFYAFRNLLKESILILV